MAIINCPGCGIQISDEVDVCPNCHNTVSYNLTSKSSKKQGKKQTSRRLKLINTFFVIVTVIGLVLFILGAFIPGWTEPQDAPPFMGWGLFLFLVGIVTFIISRIGVRLYCEK